MSDMYGEAEAVSLVWNGEAKAGRRGWRLALTVITGSRSPTAVRWTDVKPVLCMPASSGYGPCQITASGIFGMAL
jgi:hypothetical protein